MRRFPGSLLAWIIHEVLFRSGGVAGSFACATYQSMPPRSLPSRLVGTKNSSRDYIRATPLNS